MAEQKQRHGCLTAWLSLMLVLNALTAVVYVVSKDALQDQLPGAPNWAFTVLTALGVVNVICTIALLLWKKWGFYGFIATSIAAVAVNLKIGLPPGQAIAGLVGVAILYAVLQIGNETNKGWPQLD